MSSIHVILQSRIVDGVGCHSLFQGLFLTQGLKPGLPHWGLAVKQSNCNAGAAGDLGSIPGLGRSPAGGHGNPLQYSCLENPMDKGAWRATVHRVAKSGTWLKWLSTHGTCMYQNNNNQPTENTPAAMRNTHIHTHRGIRDLVFAFHQDQGKRWFL